MLDKLPPELFTDPTKTFVDPACGNGQFLAEVLVKKIENGIDYRTALSTIYGVDLMEDNCIETIKRLYMVTEDDIVIWLGKDIQKNGVIRKFALRGNNNRFLNIVCADALTYDFSFNDNV